MFNFLFRSHNQPYILQKNNSLHSLHLYLEPPKIDADALGKFSEPVIKRSGENAIFKLPFSGKEPIKVQWFKDEMELLEGPGVRIDNSSTQSRLLLNKCQRKNTGEVKIKLKNEFATTEAKTKFIVLGMLLVNHICRMWLYELKRNKSFFMIVIFLLF